ncbi:YCII-related domain protein [Grimontia celer]|uniref:YCII-related domain protein n=1 Tax=Grimontia celer TaxID=1796497 RepID=A0A128ESY4_9GAMM|nr:YciI family protein [Grimontia celer]CZF77679.1 YCII-related domain protein [Grimontia celer]
MKFALLIYGTEDDNKQLSDEQEMEMLKLHHVLQETTVEKDQFIASARLDWTDTAKTVSADDEGKPLVTDGPFAETKEQFLGLYLLDCETEGDAIAYAASLPLQHHKIEVRPVGWCRN